MGLRGIRIFLDSDGLESGGRKLQLTRVAPGLEDGLFPLPSETRLVLPRVFPFLVGQPQLFFVRSIEPFCPVFFITFPGFSSSLSSIGWTANKEPLWVSPGLLLIITDSLTFVLDSVWGIV